MNRRSTTTRLGAAAQAVGVAEGAIDYAVGYAKERIAFGQPIIELQGMQFKLADLQIGTAAARELLYRACSLADLDPALLISGCGHPWQRSSPQITP